MIRQENITYDVPGAFFWGNDAKTPIGARKSRYGDSHAKAFAEEVAKDKIQPSNYYNALQTLVTSVRMELMPKEDDRPENSLFIPPSFPVTKSFAPARVKLEDPEFFAPKTNSKRKDFKARTIASDPVQKDFYCFDRKSTWKPPKTSLKEKRRLKDLENSKKKLPTPSTTLIRSTIGTGASQTSQGTQKSRRTKTSGSAASSPIRSSHGIDSVNSAKKWSQLQSLGLMQKRQRCEHLTSWLVREMEKDMKRQTDLYNCPPHKVNSMRWDVARERTESADCIMRILSDYKFIPTTTMAHYLEESLKDEHLSGSEELKNIRDGRRITYTEDGEAKDFLEFVADSVQYKEDVNAKKQLARWKEEVKKKPNVERKQRERIRDQIERIGPGIEQKNPFRRKENYNMEQMRKQMKDFAEKTYEKEDPSLLVPAKKPPPPKYNLRPCDIQIRQPSMKFTYTDKEKAVDHDYDTDNVRDTVKLMYRLMGQQAEEPPNGRYSHLIGRWMAW